MRICVEYQELCVHRERDYSEDYGSWSEDYSSSVTRVYEIEEDEKGAYNSDVFLVPDGTERVYVVYQIYSSGDSFGSASGKIDIIHVCASSDGAHAIAKMIQDSPDSFTYKFTDDFDREISIYNVGAGYFESISYVEVEAFEIGNKAGKRYV